MRLTCGPSTTAPSSHCTPNNSLSKQFCTRLYTYLLFLPCLRRHHNTKMQVGIARFPAELADRFSGPSTSAPLVTQEQDACWICLEADLPNEQLVKPCDCPRLVHIRCLARWQLQSAGKNEENKCRFCSATLPDWKSSLTPSNVKPTTPVMAIKFEGKTYKLKVKPGPDGLREFQEQVRQLLGFDITDDFDVTFECQVPRTGEKMKLNGLSSYGAATHCAAITAAQRDAKPSRRRRSQKSAVDGAAESAPATTDGASTSHSGSASTSRRSSVSADSGPTSSHPAPIRPHNPNLQHLQERASSPSTPTAADAVVMNRQSSPKLPVLVKSATSHAMHGISRLLSALHITSNKPSLPADST